MTTSIAANPGQTVTIAVQVVDTDGVLHDGYQAPTVDFIQMPSGSNAAGYPIAMTEVTLGIWKHSFTIPSGLSGVGSYVISCSWPHPNSALFQNELFILHVSLPFGNASVSFA